MQGPGTRDTRLTQSEERTNLDFDFPCLPCETLETLKKEALKL